MYRRSSPQSIPFLAVGLWWALCAGVLAGGDETAFLRDATTPSFRHEVMAVLSKSGCNLGTCHGNQNGKGGFRLSLRGQDPDADYVTLTRQLGGRRVSPLAPDESLLLQKPLMQVPHEGGRRIVAGELSHRVLREWIAAGLRDDLQTAPALQSIRITPALSTVIANQAPVKLEVTASFADGTVHDVTRLAVFESSWPIASVSSSGLVTSDEAGLTTVTARYLNQQAAVRVEFIRDDPAFRMMSPPVNSAFDAAVFRQLERMKIQPAGLCDDRTFLRRVCLDVTGLLPEESVAREFLASSSPTKRSQLIDTLLSSEAFIDFQTLRWADLLRVEEKTLDRKGVEAYYRWIRQAVTEDRPLTLFAQQIVSARGSTYTEPATNFYRALRTPEERAEASAQLFLGIRLQCAKCHNHPFDVWTQDDYYGWTNFFARLDYKILENRRRDTNDLHEFDGEQLVFVKDKGEVRNPSTGRSVALKFLGQSESLPTESAESDRLMQLGKWLAWDGNDRFAVTQANRIWYQLMGRGVVDPIDDFRATNPPSNPDLLALLVQRFAEGGFRVRPLMREILNSSTYQLSQELNDSNQSDEVCFSHVVARRLTAEQLLDAMSQVTGADPEYGESRMVNRASRLTGVRNGGHRYSPPAEGDRFLQLFGKPDRLQTCECERSEETTLSQTFEMISGSLLDEMLKSRSGLIAAAIRNDQPAEEFLERVYWRALSRSPTHAEQTQMLEYIARQDNRRKAFEDVMWAVLNSNELLLRP